MTAGGQGLNLEVRISGAKLWSLRYVRASKYGTKALGAYPGVSLEEARDKAAAFMKSIAGCPAPSSPPGSGQFRDISRDWAANAVTGLSPKIRTKTAWPLRD
jgi:hypothetical protein